MTGQLRQPHADGMRGIEQICSVQGLLESGEAGRMLQQLALGGSMIVLPIYLQMVLEYNALKAALSLAPLSLTLFAVAIVAEEEAGKRHPRRHSPAGASPSPHDAPPRPVPSRIAEGAALG